PGSIKRPKVERAWAPRNSDPRIGAVPWPEGASELTKAGYWALVHEELDRKVKAAHHRLGKVGFRDLLRTHVDDPGWGMLATDNLEYIAERLLLLDPVRSAVSGGMH